MSTDTELSKRDRQKARRAERLAAEAKQKQKDNAKRRVVLIVAGVIAVAAVVLIGYLLVQGIDRTLGVEPAVIEGDAVPPAPAQAGVPDTAVGSSVPTVTGQTVDGEDVTIGATGTPQAVVFMAHWCPACQAEAPLVADWVEDDLLADGVELVAVSTRHDPARDNWPPDEWLERAAFPGQVLIDPDESVAQAWGLSGTPMWTFVDAEGTIVARQSGQIDADAFAQGSALAAGTDAAG